MMKTKMIVGVIIQKPTEKISQHVYHSAKMMTLVKRWNGRMLIASGGKKGDAKRRRQQHQPLNQQQRPLKILLRRAQRWVRL